MRHRLTRYGLPGLAVALMAGAAGGGALVTADSTIVGNKWTTAGSAPEAAAPDTVSVAGDPFDVTLTDQQFAQRVWTITNNSPSKSASISGAMTNRTAGGAPTPNADHLNIVYFTHDPSSSRSSNHRVDGGTVANPKPVTMTLPPKQSAKIKVVAEFVDPTHSLGVAMDQADFHVNYQHSS